MHISAMDVPSDMYGSVSDVARPLVHKLNQATMSGSTYEALEVLLKWAIDTLETKVKPDLELFTGVKGESVAEVLAIEPAKESVQESAEPEDFDDHSEGIDLSAIVAEAAEQIEEALAEPVAPAEPESVVVKPLTLDMLPDADDEEPEAVPAVAPAEEAPKVVTNPTAKAKAK